MTDRSAGVSFALAVVAALCSASPVHAEPVAVAPITRDTLTLTEGTPTRYRLENGLTVILSPDHAQDGVAVTMRYAVGASDDPPGYSGLAHLVEHMTFRGSRHLGPLEAYLDLERVGATSINGSTGPTATLYGCVVPSAQLETAIWIESERMAFTLEKVGDHSLELERRIVANEYRQRAENPFQNRILEALLPKGHPYRPREAPLDDLDAIRLRDVQWFFQQWYRPDNATLLLSGDFDQDRARGLIHQYLGPIVAPKKPLLARTPPSVRLAAVRRLRVMAPILPARMSFVWLVPLEGVALDFVAFVLQERLRLSLSTASPPGVSAHVGLSSIGLDRLFWVDVPLDKNADPRKVEDTVASVVRRLRDEPISHEEVQEARASLVSRAVLRGGQQASAESASSPSTVLDQILKIDERGVAAATRQYLRLDRRIIAELVPTLYASRRGEIDSLEDTTR